MAHMTTKNMIVVNVGKFEDLTFPTLKAWLVRDQLCVYSAYYHLPG